MQGFDQTYGVEFAEAYNRQLSSFAERIAPRLLEFFAGVPELQAAPRQLLDLCCGTGQLATRFLEDGYSVIGIDLSPAMLEHARTNNREAVDRGAAQFVIGDATEFQLENEVSFAVSTYDALNHLSDTESLQSCFDCVFRSLRSPGLFVFDLNTPLGLDRWNGISVQDSEEITIFNRGIFPAGGDRAYTSITGFLRNQDGTYTRFSEKAFNTVFDLSEVPQMVTKAGFGQVYMAEQEDLSNPVTDASGLRRAFFVCLK